MLTTKLKEIDKLKIPEKNFDSDGFMNLLENIGAFKYRKGGDDGLDIFGWVREVQRLVETFINEIQNNPVRMNKISRLPKEGKNTVDYNRYGQFPVDWQVLEDLDNITS